MAASEELTLPCEGGVWAGMESTFLSPLDGLFSQVMGDMDNLGGAVQADRRGWVERVGPQVSRQDTGDM